MSNVIEESGPGVRFGFYLKRAIHQRMNEAIAVLNEHRKARSMGKKIGQSEFLAIVSSVLSKEELINLHDRYMALLDLEEELHMRASRQMLDMAAGKPASTIIKMRDALRTQNEGKSS